ncbi:hypothetical protein HOLleu_08798 [Holothuria leucospilota]|uniref:Uncharacterized protein n=1 Tax=Holothuria leucospilota TaxID=206669 RepID=A0A9Q1HI64_HOLLE|nr:hypothetical protein HOLleu_08798 [Holothuria leucospilota]
MTDELVKPCGEGSFIARFVSGGPKNYVCEVYSTNTGQKETQCKVRGITLTPEAKHLVNVEVMSKMVDHVILKGPEEVVTVPKTHDIVRRGIGNVYTTPSKNVQNCLR